MQEEGSEEGPREKETQMSRDYYATETKVGRDHRLTEAKVGDKDTGGQSLNGDREHRWAESTR